MRISVIVPVYGVEAYIGRCAESLMAQTWPDTEFIFVDDGSPDRSVDVLQAVLDQYPDRNVHIVRKPNGGLPQARLSGLLVATGDYIVHLDSDDWLEPDALQSLAQKALESGADLIYYDFWKEYGSRQKLDAERTYTAATKQVYMRRLYRDGAYGYLWNKMARRSLYEGLFFPRYNMHEDIVVATQLLYKAGSVAQLSKPLVHYRRDNPSASTRVGKKQRRGQMARNYLDLYEYYRSNPEPIAPVVNDLLLRAAWVGYSLDRDLFTERPYLKEAARRLPLMPFHRVLLIQQLILKLFLL